MSTSPYDEAGNLLTQVITKHKSLKTVAFSKNKSKRPCSKVAYAQVCHTLQHKSILESILNHNEGRLRKDIKADSVRNTGLLYVLLFELLFGKNGSIRGGGALKRNIMKFEKELKRTKNEIISDDKMSALIDKTVAFPRYIRVNTLKSTISEVIDTLQKDLQKGHGDNEDIDCIFCDPHVPDLLVISPEASIQWHEHELVTSGKIILQDKSSCLSALALVHGNHNDEICEGDYIDACAAPGNKTTHLAALVHKSLSQLPGSSKKSKQLMANKRKIFAFDRASNRVSILRDRLSRLVPLAPLNSEAPEKSKKQVIPIPEVVALHEDFLKADPKAKIYKNVKCILLDPSCSGSGIIDNPDRLLNPVDTKEGSSGNNHEVKRIETLSNFQLLILKHAMSFPQVQRIVYSTCSVNEMENEHVAASALNEANEQIEENDMKWTIVSPMVLQGWKRRGRAVSGLTEKEANSLIRVDGRDGDETNGFFVCYFERKAISSENAQIVSPAKSFVTLVPGVKAFYSGEFKNRSKEASCVEVNNSKEVIKKVPDIAQDETHTQSESKAVSKDSAQIKSKSKMAKKRAKKIMWKRRQKENKLLRLKKKKDNTESA